MHSAAIAALVTAVLLVGGVAVAAGMGALGGHPFGLGHDRSMMDRGHEDMDRGMGHGYGGVMQGNHDSDHDEDHDSDDCPCMSGNLQAEWVNATVVSVDKESGYVEAQIGNETLGLRVMKKYVENETGYLVYGPWLLNRLSPGMSVQVLVPGGGSYFNMGYAPLLGIVLDGRTLVSPMFMDSGSAGGIAES